MAIIHSYKELIVWQKSILLVKEIYKLTNSFPKNEQFGIVSQIRRAAVSIPSNIAEGYGRKTLKDRQQFNILAYSSALEVETQIHISKELLLSNEKDFYEVDGLLSEVIRMLNKITSQSR